MSHTALHRWLARIITAVITLLAPTAAAAQNGAAIAGILQQVQAGLAALVLPVAVIAVAVAGLILIFASDEGALGKAKTAMTSVVIGGMMIAGGSALYTGSAGSIVSGAAVKAAGFLAAMSFTVGVLMVIVAAVRAIAGFGDDGAYESVKNQLLHAVVGLVIIGASGLITSTFLSVDFTGVIGLVIDRMRILIGTASVLMLAVIIYAAVRMIAGMGDESSFQQMKSTLIYATIGMIITLTAYQLTTFVAGFF